MMLLDRLAERAALGQLLGGARAGRSGVLVVRGEPGVGKTALLENAIESADGFGVAWVAGVESRWNWRSLPSSSCRLPSVMRLAWRSA